MALLFIHLILPLFSLRGTEKCVDISKTKKERRSDYDTKQSFIRFSTVCIFVEMVLVVLFLLSVHIRLVLLLYLLEKE